MSHILLTLAAILLLLAAPCVPQAQGQARRPRRAPARKPGQTLSPPGAQTPRADDQYWAAQRSIEAAIQQLEAYLRELPEGERAPTVRQQLAVLRSLTASASRPEWVPMGRLALRDVPEWRVSSVDPRADRTHISIEVTCRRADGGVCYFRPFDRFPLVLADSSGRYHPMLESSELPPDVRYDHRERRAAVPGGRSFTVMVDFAPLAAGAVSGQVYYRDENEAQPARFSLARGR